MEIKVVGLAQESDFITKKPFRNKRAVGVWKLYDWLRPTTAFVFYISKRNLHALVGLSINITSGKLGFGVSKKE